LLVFEAFDVKMIPLNFFFHNLLKQAASMAEEAYVINYFQWSLWLWFPFV